MGNNGGEKGGAKLQIGGLKDPILQNGYVGSSRVHQV